MSTIIGTTSDGRPLLYRIRQPSSYTTPRDTIIDLRLDICLSHLDIWNQTNRRRSLRNTVTFALSYSIRRIDDYVNTSRAYCRTTVHDAAAHLQRFKPSQPENVVQSAALRPYEPREVETAGLERCNQLRQSLTANAFLTVRFTQDPFEAIHLRLKRARPPPCIAAIRVDTSAISAALPENLLRVARSGGRRARAPCRRRRTP